MHMHKMLGILLHIAQLSTIRESCVSVRLVQLLEQPQSPQVLIATGTSETEESLADLQQPSNHVLVQALISSP